MSLFDAFRRLLGWETPDAGAAFALIERRFDDGGGFVVQRRSDGQFLQWQSLPRGEGLECVRVSGTSHRLSELQDARFRPGSPVLLVPEPENPYDPDAIAVWSADRQVHVGYLPKEDAGRLGRKIRREPQRALVLWETIADAGRVSIRLLIVREGVELHVR